FAPHKEALRLIGVCKRQKTTAEFQDNVARGVALHLAFAYQREARPDQEDTEEIEDPVETRNQRHACPDKHTAHDQRADNAPEEYSLFFFRWNFKICE